MDPEERAQYREVHPMGKVPLLVVDDDHLIPESSIIIEYLDGIAEPKLVFGEQPYASGEEFSMSDCAAMPALFYAQRAAPFDAYENVGAYWDRLASRPSI